MKIAFYTLSICFINGFTLEIIRGNEGRAFWALIGFFIFFIFGLIQEVVGTDENDN